MKLDKPADPHVGPTEINLKTQIHTQAQPLTHTQIHTNATHIHTKNLLAYIKLHRYAHTDRHM